MKNTNWFKDAIIYQIYPRSFKDSDNDGMGDIKGIIEKLDYLKELGINCVWLSPVYESPMDDNGYDISDYKKIYSTFGTMEDFDLMLSEMHKRGIRLIMDLVANHTSDEHYWFKESKKSKDNPYRDYYIWKDKPNNWTGFFGEKAWEYDETTDSYYFHLFGKKQPDVNWENELVRKEYKDIIKFWLDKGVDGFRCDVINLISKDQRYKNGLNPLILVGKKYYINGPRLHEYLNEINRDVLSNYDCMTVGETVFSTLDDIKLLTKEDRNELSMVFNFDHTSVDNYLGVKWLMRKFSLKRFKKTLDKYQYGLKDEEYIDKSIKNGSRDNSRVPMHWDDSEYAGFSNSKPWLKVNENKSFINVKQSQNDPSSILNYYKKLIKVYKEYGDIVRDGIYLDLLPNDKKLFTYERRLDNKILLVVSNFSNSNIKCDILDNYKEFNKEVLLNNYDNASNELKPYQSILYYLSK